MVFNKSLFPQICLGVYQYYYIISKGRHSIDSSGIFISTCFTLLYLCINHIHCQCTLCDEYIVPSLKHLAGSLKQKQL